MPSLRSRYGSEEMLRLVRNAGHGDNFLFSVPAGGALDSQPPSIVISRNIDDTSIADLFTPYTSNRVYVLFPYVYMRHKARSSIIPAVKLRTSSRHLIRQFQRAIVCRGWALTRRLHSYLTTYSRRYTQLRRSSIAPGPPTGRLQHTMSAEDDVSSRSQQSPLASQRAKQQAEAEGKKTSRFAGVFPLGYKDTFSQWVCVWSDRAIED